MATEKKKKLLVTASTFPRWKGDTEPRFVLDLAAHMTEEFDVTVLVPAAPGAADREILDGVNIVRYHYFPVHKWETLCYPGAIIPRIREKKIRVILVPFLLFSLWWNLHKMLPDFELIHAHWLIPQGVIQSFFRKPYVVTGHGGDVTSLNNNILKKLKMRCLRKAGRVTVVAGHLKEKVQEAVPEITPDIIPMGVVCSAFGKEFYVQNYFGQKERKVVLFVGRLAEKKGVKYLIEAMKQLDTILVITGDGPLRRELKVQAKSIEDRVIFLGVKTHEELKEIYASADILVIPSVTAVDGDQEGSPTVLMEAFASRIPVIATRTGGIPELLKDGVNGILVEEKKPEEIAKAVRKLLENAGLRERITEEAYKTACQSDYSVIASKYITLMKEMDFKSHNT